jgi:hypothetical protein
VSSTRGGPPRGRIGAWMGIVSVVLFVVGFIVFPTPDDDTKVLQWARFWRDSGHRVGAIIATYLMVLGLLAFVWFASSLRDRVGERGRLMFTFGSIFVAVGLVSAMIRATIPGAKEFGDVPLPGGVLAQQFDQAGFAILLVAGALSAGLFTVFASYAASRSDALPAWLCIAGYVVGGLQVLAGFFFPFVLFFLWLLITAIVLVSRGRTLTTAPADAPSG